MGKVEIENSNVKGSERREPVARGEELLQVDRALVLKEREILRNVLRKADRCCWGRVFLWSIVLDGQSNYTKMI